MRAYPELYVRRVVTYGTLSLTDPFGKDVVTRQPANPKLTSK